MKNVLVTGATGLVGSNLCKELSEKGYKIKALIRASSDTSFLKNLTNIDFHVCDMRNAQELNKALEGVDIVFHCAAQLSIMDTLDNEHASTNIQGTRNILEAALLNSVKRFVYVSTLGVLGILKDHYNDREDAPYIKVGNPYYDTKIDAERLVLNYYNDKNLPVVILRPGFLYGPRDRNGLPAVVPHLLKRQICYVGSGNNDIALTGIKNLVQALILASEKENIEGEVFNITDDQGVTISQFTRQLCDILEIPEPKIHVPISVASGIAKTVDGISKVMDKESKINEYTIALVSNNHHFDISKAREKLGYTPEDHFEEDLREAVYWYVEQNSQILKESEKYVRNSKITFASVALVALSALYLYIKSNKKPSKEK